MKVYVTKYALTAGIYTVEAEQINETMIEARRPGRMTEYFHKNDWHTQKWAALTRAEEMRTNKIASTLKVLRKLEAMTFELGD